MALGADGTLSIYIDAVDFGRIARQLERLPLEMQRVAYGRAAARTRQVVDRQYARFAARVLKIPQKHIIARTKSRIRGGDIILNVKSANIPLHEIGGMQTDKGVYVRGRGTTKGAFIVSPSAQRAAGHILRRRSFSGRLPTKMMYGPSPANAIDEKPATYEQMLGAIARNEFSKVLMQQVTYLLGRSLGR